MFLFLTWTHESLYVIATSAQYNATKEQGVLFFCQFAKYFATRWHFSVGGGVYSVICMAKLNIWELSSCASYEKGLLKFLKEQDSECINSLKVTQTYSYFFSGKCSNHSAEPTSSLPPCWSWIAAATAMDIWILEPEASWTSSTTYCSDRSAKRSRPHAGSYSWNWFYTQKYIVTGPKKRRQY